MPITPLLADDAASVCTAIKHPLKTEPGIELVGESAHFPETVAICAEPKSNSVLLGASRFLDKSPRLWPALSKGSQG